MVMNLEQECVALRMYVTLEGGEVGSFRAICKRCGGADVSGRVVPGGIMAVMRGRGSCEDRELREVEYASHGQVERWLARER